MDSTLTSQIPSTPTVTDFVHQTFTWIAPGDAGPETIELDMDYLSFFWYQNMHLGLVYGSQLGLTALMLITLLLLTHPGKRRALIYVLNVLALVLDLIRSALMAVWLTSVWNHPVVFLLRDFTPITNQDLAASIVVNVVKTLELATILTSLIFQVRVILSTATSFQRGSILSLAFLMATVTLCVQLASTVVNSRNIVLFMPADGLQLRLADLARIMQLVSTSFFLLVFVSKLGWAIRQRVRLGQSQFGPMQMVFIGSLQSMVMPVVFIAAQWKANGDFGSLSTTILAIQLPLTALWASTSLEDRLGIANQPVRQRPIAMPSFDKFHDSDEKCKSVSTGARTESTALSTLKKGSIASSNTPRLDTIPMTTTIGSLDVDVKMLERDMV